MSRGPTMILAATVGLLTAGLIAPNPARAQVSIDGDRTWAVMDVTAAVNSAIEESNESVALRERAVRRFSECSLMYGGLSTLTANADARKNYVRAQEATMVIESTIGRPLESQKRLELEEAARRSVALMLRGIKTQGDKEVGPLLKSCKALNDVGEIKNALRELSSP